MLPNPVSWWPQAPAWYYLAVFLLLLIIVWLIRRGLLWHHNRYRRLALQQLIPIRQQIDAGEDHQVALLSLAKLLKQTATTAMPGAQLQSLSGESWLQYLNATTKGEAIERGLIEWPFWPPEQLQQLTQQQLENLLCQSHSWIETHRVTD